MNEIAVFENEEFGKIEVFIQDGKEYFPATEVATLLGYSNPYKAIGDHCKKDGVTFREVIDTLGRKQQKKYINEGNLYRLIVRSKLPSAEKFETWIMEDVLPSIRKHGAYMTKQTLEKALTSPDFLIQLATQLKEEQQKRKELEAENKKMKPKVEFVDRLMKSNDNVNVGEFAKLMTDNGFVIGRNKLFAWLRQHNLLMSGNTPYQQYIDAGYFRLTETVKNIHGKQKILKMTLITPKGQQYLYNRLKRSFNFKGKKSI